MVAEKKALISLLCAAAIGFAVPAQEPEPPSPEPPGPAASPIEFERTELDFGTLLTGSVATAGIEFRNPGSSELRIQRIQASCGCFKPTVILGDRRISAIELVRSREPLVLKAGEKARLEIAFDAKGRSGLVEKKIWFFIGDERPERVGIDAKAQCDPGFTTEPKVFNFEEPVVQGSEATRSVVIERSPRWKGKITGTTYRLPGVSAKWEPVESPDGESGTRTRIDLTITKDAKVGPFYWPLELSTDSEEVPVIRIPVRAEVTPVVQCRGPSAQQPRLVDFGLVKGNEPVSLDASIVNHDPSVPYAVRRVVVKSRSKDHIEAKIVTEEEGVRYKLRLTVLPTLTAERFNGQVSIESDHPHVPELQIWFRGGVKRQ